MRQYAVMMARLLARWVLPTTLVLLAVYLLAGCLYVPLPNIPQDGTKNAATEVGGVKSNRPLRATMSSRERVIEHLGPPWFTSADNRTVGYRWVAATGYVIPMCSNDDITLKDGFVLLLRFDEAGTLQTFRVQKDRSELRRSINEMLPAGQTVESSPPKL
jgi:hypothetical protein